MKKILLSLLIIILIIVLFATGYIAIEAYRAPNEIPSFLGWKMFIVKNDLMKSIKNDDIAIIKETNYKDLTQNDIIAYRNQNGIVEFKRIIKIDTDELEVKGDNYIETNNIKEDQIEGKYIFKIPRMGGFASFITTPYGLTICLAIPIIFLIILQFREYKKDKDILQKKEDKIKDTRKDKHEK